MYTNDASFSPINTKHLDVSGGRPTLTKFENGVVYFSRSQKLKNEFYSHCIREGSGRMARVWRFAIVAAYHAGLKLTWGIFFDRNISCHINFGAVFRCLCP